MTHAASLARPRPPWTRLGFWTGGLTLSGSLSLLSVVSVLIVVSVPRLRGLAVQENEADARATVQLLGRALGEAAAEGERVLSLRELLARPELASLSDVELVAEGALLRRHGYLFEVAPAAGGILAWPWALGRTGVTAYWASKDGQCTEHANVPARWDGLGARGTGRLDPAGWSP